jgi:hypothetical protein
MLAWITEDSYLEEAIEEIMYDEYLHAKFLRKYMMEKGLYKPSENPEYESRFLKIDSE